MREPIRDQLRLIRILDACDRINSKTPDHQLPFRVLIPFICQSSSITSLALIRYRNENEILAAAEDPDKAYVEQALEEAHAGQTVGPFHTTKELMEDLLD